MGFMESLQNGMMKLFGGSGTSRVVREWAENLTMEEIEEMERQGCDMSEYRATYAERQAEKELALKAALEMLAYEKLDEYKATPRDVEGEFVQDTMAFLGIKAKHTETIANARIVYTAVVQAHSALWKPGANGAMGMVIVFALDAPHMYDMDWLRAKAKKISDLKESKDVPKDCDKMIKTLRDSQSIFCYKVGDSVSEGADLWCGTYTVYNQPALAGGCIPVTRIVPFLLMEQPRDKFPLSLHSIPSQFYTK